MLKPSHSTFRIMPEVSFPTEALTEPFSSQWHDLKGHIFPRLAPLAPCSLVALYPPDGQQYPLIDSTGGCDLDNRLSWIVYCPPILGLVLIGVTPWRNGWGVCKVQGHGG